MTQSADRSEDGAIRSLRRRLPWLLLGVAFVLIAAGCASVTKPQGWAGPALAGDTLYVSIERGKMAALNQDGMSVKWVFPPDTSEGKKLDLEGIYGSPVVTADTIYFGAYDGNVYALSTQDGSQRWGPFETGGPIVSGVAARAAGAAQTIDRLFVGSEDGRVYALDPNNKGAVVHTFDAGDPVWATPLVTESAVYVATVGGRLFALDPETLDPLWAAPFKADAALLTDPVLADKNTVLVGGIGKQLYAVDASDGSEKWSFKAGSWFWGRPLVDGGIVYVPNLDHKVYALNVADGSNAWQQPFQAEASVRSSPLLAGSVLLIVDRHGNVSGLDPRTGKSVWSGPSILAKAVLSDPLLLPDTPAEVLIVAEGGDLFTVDPQAGSTRLVEVPG
ncbi:MAG: PQQ-binding-like beta-propeller repeat protein [Dehalococcoidia bacterium]|nr:PQQ-binding-like beta-propeller repeat protein [Dehalococcoidia bacterium]